MSAAAPVPLPAIACRDLTIAIAGRTLVADLALRIEPGSLTCILGCNGAGKTLTLHTLAGMRGTTGEILIEGRALRDWPRRALARSLALLTQDTEDAFPSTVLEAVLVGRHPHLDFWQWEAEPDRQIARAALAEVALSEFAEREVASLSGGERRRVAIAAVLAQQARLLLLDEPLNHLDPHHQALVMRQLLRRRTQGHAILMSVHDAGLAARYADDVLLLFGAGQWCFGPTAQVLTAAAVARLYSVPVRELTWEHGRTFITE
jgi:iron complex transport system ATP-binding protein